MSTPEEPIFSDKSDNEYYSQATPRKLIEIAADLQKPSELYPILRAILLRLQVLDVDDPDATALREAYLVIDALYEEASTKRPTTLADKVSTDADFYRIIQGQFPDREEES